LAIFRHAGRPLKAWLYATAAYSKNGASQLKPEDFQKLAPVVQHFWSIVKSLELKQTKNQTFQFELSLTDEVFSCCFRSFPESLPVLDTMLASTLLAGEVASLLTLNRDDFEIFGSFSFPK
jgi:hypothetical protein